MKIAHVRILVGRKPTRVEPEELKLQRTKNPKLRVPAGWTTAQIAAFTASYNAR